MSKQSSVQAKSTISPGLTRSNASLPERQRTLGPHVCVQREAVGHVTQPAAPSLVRDVVESPGRPLDAATRSFMEPRLGYDFSQVRVHTDNRAAESARAVSANAYTAGNHVAFDAGKYAPGAPGGQRLLAHELTHVVQQASQDVAGTPIGDGVHLSHPSDPFERKAVAGAASIDREPDHSTQNRDDGLPVPIQKQTGGHFVQRDSLGLSTGEADKPDKNVNTAAALSSYSAIGSAVGGLVSAFAAIRAANFAGRSAEAAEDPPTAEPTTGGLTVTDADISEVKGFDLTAGDQDPDITQTMEETTTTPKKAGTTTKKTTAKVIKPPDKPDKLDTWKVLNINQGPADSVDFYASIRSSGKDIKDGGTEPPESTGYLGGSSHANASVNFKARPGQHDETGAASVRLFVGGTNTPPRKFLQSTGIFGGGGPVANEKYNVQRFGGAITFFAPGEKKPEAEKKPGAAKEPAAEKKPDAEKKPVVDPRLLKAGKLGDGKQEALVTISMPRSHNPTKGGVFHKDDDPTSPQ